MKPRSRSRAASALLYAALFCVALQTRSVRAALQFEHVPQPFGNDPASIHASRRVVLGKPALNIFRQIGKSGDNPNGEGGGLATGQIFNSAGAPINAFNATTLAALGEVCRTCFFPTVHGDL